MAGKTGIRIAVAALVGIIAAGSGIGVSHAIDSQATTRSPFDGLRQVVSKQRLSPDEQAGHLYNHARKMARRGQTQKALALCDQAIELKASSETLCDVFELRAKLHQQEGCLDKATEDYTGIIRLSRPGIRQADAYSRRAALYDRVGKRDRATMDRSRLSSML